ncbi:MAG: tryptophan--tRNA ligase [Candidatus Heimdallarchaeota archaeon]|nr:tryptophan--tRNA ligase [Candidatus Heimdallarchaeota archaeon]
MQTHLTKGTFGVSTKDEKKVMTEFGVRDIREVADSLEPKLLHKYLRRGIMFGHTDAGKVFKAIKDRSSFAIMTGLKPTGPYHIGSLMTCNEVLFFQSLGGKVFLCVADMEAYLNNGVSLEEGHKTAIDNIADILALGLADNGVYIYKQSEEPIVLRLAAQFSSNVTYNMMKGIFGEHSFGVYQSALIQAGDILLPQLDEFCGPLPTITPVGLDQAPHSRLTRDIAQKREYQKQFQFVMPSFTFHRLIGGLDGSEKMSKHTGEELTLTLSDDEQSLSNKIATIFSGGRATKKEQLKCGGQPEKCRVFDLFNCFFMERDQELEKRYTDCKAGAILCGECKQDLYERAMRFIETHQMKKEGMIDHAKQILERE